MKRIARLFCLLLILSLLLLSTTATIGSSQTVNWASMRGVAYRSGANVWYCVHSLPACDSPTVAPPNVAFAVYKQAGFNFARISLDWNFMWHDQTNALAILTADANACDANGIYCYYMWGGSYQFIPSNLLQTWGCAGSGICFLNNFGSNAVIPTASGTPWDGQASWQAIFNGLFKPAIQLLDSHPSTVGYAPLNEPNTGWPQNQLISYYHYEAQQFRTLTSKAFIFQANGGSNGGSGAATIEQLAPTGYGPFVFEIHNYQGVLNYNPYPQVASDCATAGCTGWFVGEWGNPTYPSGYASQTQFITDEITAIHNNGGGNQWFDYSGSNPTTGALPSVLQTLSQIDYQILGGTQTTTSSATSSTTKSTTTSVTTTTTTASSTSPATSTSASTTSSSSLSYCSTSNVCLSWGYAPTTVSPGASTQWQGLVTVPTGTNPSGIPIVWYLDGRSVYSTTTNIGGAPTQGVSYFNAQLVSGTHVLNFAISNAQSPTLIITVGVATTTTTRTTSSPTSSTTTSASTSSTSVFLSSSSSSSYSSSSASTITSTQGTTTSNVSISTSTTTTTSTFATTQTSSSSNATITSGSSSASSASTNIVSSTSLTSIMGTSTYVVKQTTTAPSNSGTSVYLYPSTSSVAVVSGATGLGVVVLVAAERLKERRIRFQGET